MTPSEPEKLNLAKALETVLREEEVISAEKNAIAKLGDDIIKINDKLLAEMKILAAINDPDKVALVKIQKMENAVDIQTAKACALSVQLNALNEEAKVIREKKEGIRRLIRQHT